MLLFGRVGAATVIAEIGKRRNGPIHKEGRWCSWAFCARAFAGQFSGTLLILTWGGMEARRLHAHGCGVSARWWWHGMVGWWGSLWMVGEWWAVSGWGLVVGWWVVGGGWWVVGGCWVLGAGCWVLGGGWVSEWYV